jgi:hypothetical protein
MWTDLNTLQGLPSTIARILKSISELEALYIATANATSLIMQNRGKNLHTLFPDLRGSCVPNSDQAFRKCGYTFRFAAFHVH